MEVNNEGDVVWNHTYDILYDQGLDIIEKRDGSFILNCLVKNISSGEYSSILLNIESNGSIPDQSRRIPHEDPPCSLQIYL